MLIKVGQGKFPKKGVLFAGMLSRIGYLRGLISGGDFSEETFPVNILNGGNVDLS